MRAIKKTLWHKCYIFIAYDCSKLSFSFFRDGLSIQSSLNKTRTNILENPNEGKTHAHTHTAKQTKTAAGSFDIIIFLG